MSARFGNKQEKYSVFTDALQGLTQSLRCEGHLKPVVLFGSHDFLLNKTAEFIFRLLVRSSPESGKLKADLSEYSDSQFLELFQQTSLFEEHHITWIKRCETKQKFEKFLSMLPESSVNGQNFIFTYGKTKLNKGLESEIRRLGWQSLECAVPSPYRMPQYISQSALEKKLKLTPRACAFLHEMLGDNLTSIENELNRLSLLIQPGTSEVDQNEIAKFCRFLREDDAFKITDAIMAGDRAKVDALVFKLLRDGTQPLSIIGVISRLLRTTALMQSQSTVGTVTLPPRIKDKYKTYSRKISNVKITLALVACQKADIQSKSSKGSAYLNISSILSTLY